MGKRDNRRSMKMRRKTRQKKLKARIKRRKPERTKTPAALALLHVSVPAGAQVRIKHGESDILADVQAVPPAT